MYFKCPHCGKMCECMKEKEEEPYKCFLVMTDISDNDINDFEKLRDIAKENLYKYEHYFYKGYRLSFEFNGHEWEDYLCMITLHKIGDVVNIYGIGSSDEEEQVAKHRAWALQDAMKSIERKLSENKFRMDFSKKEVFKVEELEGEIVEGEIPKKIIPIKAWITKDDIEGKVVAKVGRIGKLVRVDYLNNRARTDSKIQALIEEISLRLKNED